jgi:hypothetical protein
MSRSDSQICLWHRGESLACAGAAVGLLRDNVEHFLERGVRSGRFRGLHALADVPWGTGPLQLEPSEFRAELMVGWDGVWRVPTREIVVSVETRALLGTELRGLLLGPAVISAWLARAGCIAPISTLGELIANLVNELSVLAAMVARFGPSEVIQCATPRLVPEYAALRQTRSVSLGPSGPFSS